MTGAIAELARNALTPPIFMSNIDPRMSRIVSG